MKGIASMLKPGAYVSPTQRKKALKKAGYGPGGSVHQPRCSNCIHCRPFSGSAGTQHDRDCTLFRTTVKTHRVCDRFQASTPPAKGKAKIAGRKRLDKPAVRTCRACGCTDMRACEGGCWWVAQDLCSACAGRKA